MYRHGFNTLLLWVMGWWAFDVFTQLASTLPTNYLGGQAILRNIGLYTFMIPAGLSMSSGILVGRQIGKNRVDMATRMYSIIKCVTFTWSLAQIVIVYFGENAIINFYTKDSTVKSAVQPAWYVICVFVYFDCMQSNGSGNINALGKLSEVKFTSTFNYWIIGIPLSCVLMFKFDMKLEGLWYGPTVAVFLNYAFYEYKINTIDWQEVCDKHQEKMRLKSLEKKDQKEPLVTQETTQDPQDKKSNSIQEGGEYEEV